MDQEVQSTWRLKVPDRYKVPERPKIQLQSWIFPVRAPIQVTQSLSSQQQLEAIEKVTNVKTDVKSVTGKSNTCVKEGLFIREVCSSLTQRVSLGAEHQLLFQVLVSLGKLHDGEEKSKEGDIDIGVHDEDGALYSPRNQKEIIFNKVENNFLIE